VRTAFSIERYYVKMALWHEPPPVCDFVSPYSQRLFGNIFAPAEPRSVSKQLASTSFRRQLFSCLYNDDVVQAVTSAYLIY